MSDRMVTVTEIEGARHRIAGYVRRTPLAHSPSLSRVAGCDVHLKLEHQQITGSFKLRGAANTILTLDEAERSRGVTAVSTGNHGRGLAFAAKQAGARCVICMSRLVPRNKVDAIGALGAEVRIIGDSQDEAQIEVDRLVAEEGMVMVPPFDRREVIAGQGTLGLELLEDLPQLGAVLVPVSGGGLISGIARAVKAGRPAARVIGISMRRGAAMYESQRSGHPVQVCEEPSLADSLGGGIGLDNRHTFAMVRELVDELVLVSEEEIADAIAHAYWEERQIVEGAGAVGIAALKAGRVRLEGAAAIVLSGGNIDMAEHYALLSSSRGAA